DVDEPWNDRLAGDVDDLRACRALHLARRADVDHPVAGDDDVALLDHLALLGPLHRDDPRAGQHHRSLWARPRRFDDGIELVGGVGVDRLPEDRAAERPDDGRAVGGPREVVAAFTRDALHGDGRVLLALDADLDRLTPGFRDADDDVLVLEADERAAPIRRHADLRRGGRVVARAVAGDLHDL